MEKTGQAYAGFAQVYDLFMDNVPYEEWAEYLAKLFWDRGIKDGLVLDLGCGTGELTRRMRAKGYDMIGVDNSPEMLAAAREESVDEPSILYLLQDMREFELYGTVRAVYCACDSINYLLSEEDLRSVFALVNNYLDPGGIFVFDCNTPYKYQEILADNTFAENRREGSFIWENYYDRESGVNQYDLTLYVRAAAEEDRYERFEETHLQRGYPKETMIRLLEEAGLVPEEVFDAYTKESPRSDSERLLFVARESGK